MLNLTVNPLADTNTNTNILVSGTYTWQPALQFAVDSGALVNLPLANSQPVLSGVWQYLNDPLSVGSHTISIHDPDSGLVVLQNVNIVPPPAPPPPLPPIPSVLISINPSSFIVGNTSNLAWSSTNVNSAVINQGIGNVALSGSMVVNPLANTIYTITATGAGGVVNASATITVLPVPVPPPPPPPVANVVYIQRGSGSFTLSANVYTLDISGNCIENSKLIPGGGGTSQMAGYNNAVYGQDAVSKTWWIWNQRSWSGPVTAPPPPPPPPPSPKTESNSNTVITTTSGQIFDVSLNLWTLANTGSFPFQVANNNISDTRTSNVAMLLYYNHAVYQQNKVGNWWYDAVNGTWNGPVADPRIVVVPPPIVVPPVVVPPIVIPPPSGNFSVSNGQLISPAGKPFKTKGICMNDTTMVPASTLLSKFPKHNVVNFALGAESGGGYSTAIPTASIFAWVNDAIARGLIVILSDYVPGQPAARSGTDLTNCCNWYASLAKNFIGNPNVWFTTSNETKVGVSGAPVNLDQSWQAIYAAIRSTGNNNMIWLEAAWGNIASQFGTLASSIANMRNVGYLVHQYELGPLATSQAQADATIKGYISAWQNYGKSLDGVVPVFMGEGGNSSGGSVVQDNIINGNYVSAKSIDNLCTNGPGGFCGYAMWVWQYGGGNPSGYFLTADNLVAPFNNSSYGLSQYGQQIANQIVANPPG